MTDWHTQNVPICKNYSEINQILGVTETEKRQKCVILGRGIAGIKTNAKKRVEDGKVPLVTIYINPESDKCRFFCQTPRGGLKSDQSG